jgi:hypothetical protein
MDERARQRRPMSWTARVLAPVAIAVTALVAVVVIISTLDGGDSDGGERENRAEAEADGCQPEAEEAVELGYYVVAPDEPGLSSVEARTCIPIDRLINLNPNLDPQLIPVNGCVNLKPEGCKELAQPG